LKTGGQGGVKPSGGNRLIAMGEMGGIQHRFQKSQRKEDVKEKGRGNWKSKKEGQVPCRGEVIKEGELGVYTHAIMEEM